MTHTPGPWDVYQLADDQDTYGSHANKMIITASDHSIEVCGVVHNQADAPLIAAVPNLLDALRVITAAARSWHDFHHGSNCIDCDEICAALPAAEAAIARAEGQS